jgi:hypothetical protein
LIRAQSTLNTLDLELHMVTTAEILILKPVVDGLLALYKNAKTAKLRKSAEQALTEAIRELLLAPQNLKSAEAKIAIAKAAGIISADLVLADEMLSKHKVAAKKAAPAKKAAAKKAAPAKKAAAKKAAPAKKAAAKKAV